MFKILLSKLRDLWKYLSDLVAEEKTPNIIVTKIDTTTNSILLKKDKILSIINVFETGSIEGDYSNVSIFYDGPNDIRQVTYGRSQTTEYGNLLGLIRKYVNANGIHSEFFKSYLIKIGKTSLVNDKAFISKLKEAGRDPIMKKSQDEFFDEKYWIPALNFCKENKFVHPLSALVIYDSFIHSGSVLKFLRNKFEEVPPAQGGNEEKWIKSYLDVRDYWLEHHSRPILRKTIYRTRNMLNAVENNDWQLDKPFNANGVIVK